MLIKYQKKQLFSILILIAFLFSFLPSSNAAISGCSVSASTSTIVSPSSNVTFSITNNDPSNSIRWVRIAIPNDDFIISDYVNPSDWPPSPQGNAVYFTGNLAPSQSVSFEFRASGPVGASGSWSVQASDDFGGGGAIGCGGSTQTTIVTSGDVNISNVSVSEVTSASVKVSWSTDGDADSAVDYGTTDAYGSTKTDSTNTTSHAITINGLSANQTYHYKVRSTGSSGTPTESSDNTFITAKQGVTTVTSTTSLVTVTSTAPPVRASTGSDRSFPSVIVATDLSRPFLRPPLITGTATDNTGVTKVEYSTDGGKNWSSAALAGRGGFSFTPNTAEDGNYKLLVRARDANGNIGFSKIYTLIIDRIPPSAGGAIISLGAQILKPNQAGFTSILSGLDHKITLSAVGGPVTIDVLSGTQTFSLARNPDNGLWIGAVNIEKEGVHELKAVSVDGAGNKTEGRLTVVNVLKSGKTLPGAKISLFYKDPLTQQFVLWEGESYGQKNPQATNENGEYALLVPPGTYYLQIGAPAYRTLKTNIFTLERSTPIVSGFNLEKKAHLTLGPISIPLPDFRMSSVAISFLSEETEPQKNILVGKALPSFVIQNESGTLAGVSLRGKPTIITFINTWLPETSEQISVLEELQNNKEVEIAAVIPQESPSSVLVFKRRGGYNVRLIADPDNSLAGELKLGALPVHLFIDGKGIIKNVKEGFLNEDEILGNVVN